MEKIVSVNLAGRVFPIEEIAYHRLLQYFNGLRTFYDKTANGESVVADLESRIAEMLSARIVVGHPTVQIADVEAAIASIGQIEDLTRPAGRTSFAPGNMPENRKDRPVTPPRRGFYRNSNDKATAGIASGIAYYLGLNTTLVRVLMVLLFFTGWGIIGYLLVWAITPEAPLESQSKTRLYRSRTDKWIAGVCGGLAAAFNKPAWLFRMIFLLPVVFGIGDGLFMHLFGSVFITGSLSGTLILIYILLWMLMPRAHRGEEQADRLRHSAMGVF